MSMGSGRLGRKVLVIVACLVGSACSPTASPSPSVPAGPSVAAVPSASTSTSAAPYTARPPTPTPALDPRFDGFALCPRQPGFMANEWLCDTLDVPLDR